MLSHFIELVLFRIPGIKSCLINRWYQYLTARYTQREWTFMNYGYAHLNGEKKLALHTRDEADRHCIQLYHHVTAPANVLDKKILEIGSGRGGGASYLARYLKPKSIVGIDLSSNAVDLCNRMYSQPNLSFQTGDAMKIPFPDRSFDVVINVESSHCYQSMKDFIREVIRVLRPGGFFSWADILWKRSIEKTTRHFRNPGLRSIREWNITPSVLHALKLDHDRKLNTIKCLAPKFTHKMICEFAAVKGTKTYKSLKDQRRIYLSKIFQKV
ncbi:class I SAM-dependent methyltransferase [candidate division WOR-3 bacterium]|nr:class I SAM-dependent methyltransferase [candidate division WOR-3 bacterium]